VTDEMLARLRAHDNNIIRYRRLLETNLSELERGFIERRLNGNVGCREPGSFCSHPTNWDHRPVRRGCVLIIARPALPRQDFHKAIRRLVELGLKAKT
jgi:hypothetical protein